MQDAHSSREHVTRDFKFSDAVMFSHIMQDEDICKGFLEIVLGIEIERIEYCETEMHHMAHPASKPVFMDVFVKGTDRVFDIEMQTCRFPHLGSRLRYYQGAMDASVMRRGASYKALPESYIIFLCTYDPFGSRLSRYTFKTLCEEDPSIDAKSGQTWVVLNAKAWRNCPDKRVSELLEYVEDGTVSDTSLIKRIDLEVRTANADPVWKDGAMGLVTLEESIAFEKACYYQDGREDGLAEGRAEGLTEGETKGITKGEARNKALVERLLSDNRLDDLKRSVEDSDYCDKLYKEYGL